MEHSHFKSLVKVFFLLLLPELGFPVIAVFLGCRYFVQTVYDPLILHALGMRNLRQLHLLSVFFLQVHHACLLSILSKLHLLIQILVRHHIVEVILLGDLVQRRLRFLQLLLLG